MIDPASTPAAGSSATPAAGSSATPAGGSAATPAGGHRRAFTIALLLCVAGAGLAIYAVTRVWLVEVTERAAPLSPLRVERTGGDLLSWLQPLAVVSLAGAGAVLATRGLTRRLIGGLLAVLGVAMVAGAAFELAEGLWPVLTGIGGLAVFAAGGWTAVRGAHWPSMGARYERSPHTAEKEPLPALNAPRGTRQAWDALDRGEDPTGD
ncbi:Trp biosynthesis-associated membrane protein [Catenuloplanes sp. NPDC051500]|uniref:Trp biosynthesis-associated membrane protein n=1 Tax=Catenuloplanes sp. NPDC051500 TaxID=3363959 RepID=UPI003793C38D